MEGLPEVYGGFICEAGQGIVASRLNLLGGEEDCLDIFQKVENIFAMASVHYTDIKRLKFCYESTILLAYPVDSVRWLFLTHSEAVAPGLVEATVDVALKAFGGGKAGGTPAAQDTVKTEMNLASLIAPGGELHDLAARIQKALNKIVGPIGEIMLEDALQEWDENGVASPDTVTELMVLIEKEVDDKEQFDRFQELLGSV